MIGKLLMTAVLVLIVVGVVVMLGEKFPSFKLGRLPGDIVIERDGTRVIIPIMSVLVVSAILAVGLSILKLFRL